MRVRSFVTAATLFVVFAFIAVVANATSGPTIAPSHLHTGKNSVVVHAPGCTDPNIEVFGSVISSGSSVLEQANPDQPSEQKYSGFIVVKASAKNGKHEFTVRCGGGTVGVVHVTTAGGKKGGGKNGGGKKGGGKNGGGAESQDTLRLGWVYAGSSKAVDHEPFHSPKSITDPACKSKKGKQLKFDKNSEIYDARQPVPADFKLGHDGSFHDDIYVSPSLQPGTLKVGAECMSQFDLPLFHTKITFHVVRKVFTDYRSPGAPGGAAASTSDAFQTFHTGPNNTPGAGDPASISVPACQATDVTSITLNSPGLTPNVQTSFMHNDESDFNPHTPDGTGSWSTVFLFSDIVAVGTPGLYPVSISCGSGVVATSMIRVQPAPA